MHSLVGVLMARAMTDDHLCQSAARRRSDHRGRDIAPPAEAARRHSTSAMRGALAAFAALQLLTGALLWLTPGFFHDQIGPFGPRNDHYMGDLATWYLALGTLILAAVRRKEWRGPLLALALMQTGLHAFNHLLDAGAADPAWIGPVTLFLLVLVTGAILWLRRQTGSQPR